MAKPGDLPAGILLVDKPSGPTSHDLVSRARRALDTGRIGHTGTLDPFASGLLILCVGRATRLVEYLQLLRKSYTAAVRFGEETETHDPEGEVVRRSGAWRELNARGLERVLADFTGEIRQVPPAFSAKRVAGRRAHRMARAGEPVELEPVRVRVDELRLAAWDPPVAQLRARVSAGTYLRALARDLGRAAGCGAHLAALRRTRIGPFPVSQALDAHRLEPGLRPAPPAWRAPVDALSWLPRRELDPEELRRVRHGAPVARRELRGPVAREEPWGAEDPEGEPESGAGAAGRAGHTAAAVALVGEGRLVAVGEVDGPVIRPRKVFDAA